uniref:Uncharacterized protein n=1 Tax=Sphaerodactylus townsendi TaxID=933632 RepID=A0ACB8FW09_9SAUR
MNMFPLCKQFPFTIVLVGHTFPMTGACTLTSPPPQKKTTTTIRAKSSDCEMQYRAAVRRETDECTPLISCTNSKSFCMVREDFCYSPFTATHAGREMQCREKVLKSLLKISIFAVL